MIRLLRKLKFSLGTLVLLTLALSALTWLNVAGMRGTDQKIGWPFQVLESETTRARTPTTFEYDDFGRLKSVTTAEHVSISHVAVDAFAVLGILILICILSEWLLLPVLSRLAQSVRATPFLPRVHLATAIVLMFFASALLWLNVRPQRSAERFDPEGRLIQYNNVRGWPVPCYTDSTVYLWWRIDPPSSEPEQQQRIPVEMFFAAGLGENLAVSALCLVIVAIVCEWWVKKAIAI